MKTAIVTDSSSGITQALAKELGVYVVPMPFYINDETFYEDVNLTQEEFYEKLKSDADVATSQPIVGELLDFWNKVLEENDEMVYIPLSSGLSMSCSTAISMAKEKDYEGKVFVVDNQRVSVTLRESVYDAVKMKNQGKSASEIQQYLTETRKDSGIYIMVDTMKYLKKGGRVTPAAAAIGSLLKLRPVLQIQGDKLDKYALARTLNKAKEAMIDAIKSDLYGRFYDYTKKGEMVLSFAHTENFEEIEKFKEEVCKVFPEIPVHFTDPLPLTISCHIGPGALAVTATRMIKE